MGELDLSQLALKVAASQNYLNQFYFE